MLKNYAACAVAIGDAACSPEAAFIYGVTLAMFSGKIVGDLLPDVLAKGDLLEEAFSIFYDKTGETLNPEYGFNAAFKANLLDDPEKVKDLNHYAKLLPDYPNLKFDEVVQKYLTKKSWYNFRY